jgi:hypothetical protein
LSLCKERANIFRLVSHLNRRFSSEYNSNNNMQKFNNFTQNTHMMQYCLERKLVLDIKWSYQEPLRKARHRLAAFAMGSAVLCGFFVSVRNNLLSDRLLQASFRYLGWVCHLLNISVACVLCVPEGLVCFYFKRWGSHQALAVCLTAPSNAGQRSGMSPRGVHFHWVQWQFQ